MTETDRMRLARAIGVMLRPIFKILLEFNVTYHQFAEGAKLALVDVASKEYGKRDRRTNISRIATMTGMTRKEVKRLRETFDGTIEWTPRGSVIDTLIYHWSNDEDFTDDGNPRHLSYEDGENTFTELVRRFGGDLPAGAVRTEMLRMRMVELDEKKDLVLVRKDDFDQQALEKAEDLIRSSGAGMADAIAHEVLEPKKGSWKVSMASSHSIRSEDKEKIENLCRSAMNDLEKRLDNIFDAYETIHGDQESEKARMTFRIGSFMIEGRDS